MKGNWRGERWRSLSENSFHRIRFAILPLGNYSCLKVELTFTRDRAFYFTTVFIPGIILVTSSFITFWLEWNAVPARWDFFLFRLSTWKKVHGWCHQDVDLRLTRTLETENLRNLKKKTSKALSIFWEVVKGMSNLDLTIKATRQTSSLVMSFPEQFEQLTSSNLITLTLLLGASSFLRCRVMIGEFH